MSSLIEYRTHWIEFYIDQNINYNHYFSNDEIFLIFFKDIFGIKFGINEIFKLPLFKKIFSMKQYCNKEKHRFEFYANTICQKCVK